ncbi:MAG: hypothetical protein NZ846_09560 [Thermus sp.]|uniref:hypothetical protein n=1 Tax=Thermus sp. TaxID=275 RepID=UPI0025D48F73|nr:hypothetical protein [Thermus sp.]MCS7219202.1 hypothetical protein [Thermus sp.]
MDLRAASSTGRALAHFRETLEEKKAWREAQRSPEVAPSEELSPGPEPDFPEDPLA